ncbi:hypothetical protein GH714_032594 [Hevea brasiliensis]|uniref:Enolase C-terminal domain-containing protein n=1 Tax=Hevea brasiliensis TaxID=3981 RepID=A0A6A6L5I4_HEVBR|nr:hypothetical protein GH714_032594 [Hevea brasiliensis]
MVLNLVLNEIRGILPGTEFASVRAGVEMALIDAVANGTGVPLWRLFDSGISPAFLEQPVHRDDRKGLGEFGNFVRENYGISVAVDESSKFGVMGALEIIELARNSGVNLMISSTVETRLATGFAAHLAAGLGCFKFAGLDTPFLISEDPVFCGYEDNMFAFKLMSSLKPFECLNLHFIMFNLIMYVASGPVYKFLNARGQGDDIKGFVDRPLSGS